MIEVSETAAGHREDAIGSRIMIYDTPLHTLAGKPTQLSEYRGRALLLVNVASKCGLTPQYEQLQAVHERFAERGLTVIGFPCNQFGKQEPGSADEIQEFCSVNYGVSFPIMEKIDVNGADRNPIYDVLTKVPDASGRDGDIQWNFEKFVVSADGNKVVRFAPTVKPDDPALIAAIEAALP
jgi:glutathione peroxidase